MKHGYEEHPPTLTLSPWVACFWCWRDETREKRTYRALPDGCIDIVFELDGTSVGNSFVAGMMTHSTVVTKAGAQWVFAVRFKSAGAAAFFKEPLCRLTNEFVDLIDLWPRSNHLCEQIFEAGTMQKRIELFEGELAARMISGGLAAQMETAVTKELLRDPNCRIERLCRRLPITRQALAKAFHKNVGVSPKMLGRIFRMQKLLKQIQFMNRAELHWSELAQEAGYYDQSHMINEFQKLSGVTPQTLAGRNYRQLSIFPILGPAGSR